MSSACEGVRPDVRAFGVRGRPVGRRKRRLLVLAGAEAGAGETIGVDARGVVSSREPTKRGEEMPSARVRLDPGLSEEPNPSEWLTSRFTGPSRLSEMTFVELLLPRMRPSNTAS